jgi:membrane-bound lytic murein transglycosylase A
MSQRLTLAVIVAIALSGCSAQIIPQGPRSSASPPRAAPEKPTPSKPVVRPAPVIAPKPVETSSPKGPNAVLAGLVAGPDYASFGVSNESATRALDAFRISCGSLQRRTDGSGLTKGSDWASTCAAAVTARDAQAFFSNNFEVVQVGDGKSLATGYYEPEIAGARTQSAQYNVPVYKRPSDIIDVDLGLFSDDLKGKRVRGRVKGTSLIPYADRAEIEEGWLTGRGLELAWAADPVEFFFLQVQGSGRLRLPDGSVMRIGYDGQNGRDYTGIGKLMKDRGLLGPGQTSMQGIMAYLRANPEEGRAIMRENKSWIFFKELTGAGPLGALGLPVTPKGTVAADPMFVPLGAPVLLSTDRSEANGLWVAQDTGGAIKGSNRFDTFWGAGSEARTIAGGMSARGSAFLLLPKGTVARLKAEAPVAGTPPQR